MARNNFLQEKQFIYGVDENRGTIFECSDYFIGVIIKESPVTCLALFSRHFEFTSPFIHSQEFHKDVQYYLKTGDTTTLEYKYSRICYQIDDEDKIERFLPTKESYTKAMRHAFSIAQRRQFTSFTDAPTAQPRQSTSFTDTPTFNPLSFDSFNNRFSVSPFRPAFQKHIF